MSEIRPYYSTRQIIDVDSFLEERDEYYLMCVSKAQLHALRVMAKTRLLWPTTWAKEKYQQTYLLPDAVDFDAIHEHISEWIAESETIEMCNQALVGALENIASAITLSSCCAGAGAGGQQIGDDFYYGTETPLDEPTSFGGGEEYATEAEYLADKCATANAIVNSLIGSLNSMSILTLASLVAGSVAVAIIGVGLLTVPPVAVLVALAFTGLAFGALSTLASEIDDNKTDLVCLLYNSTGATNAYDSMKAWIEEISLDIGFVEVEIGALADVVMNLCPIDTLNALFTSVGLPEVPGDTVTCETACLECLDYFVSAGTLDEDTLIAESELITSYTPNREIVSIYFNRTEDNGEWCGDPVTLTFTKISGTPQAADANPPGVRFYNQAGAVIYSHNTNPPASPVANVGSCSIYNDVNGGTPFTIQLSVT
jgi:hypothetical protein